MIRINLLPVKQKQRQYTVVYQLIVGGVVVMILLAGCAIDYFLQKRVEGKLITERGNLERKIEDQKRLIGEVEQFEQKENELKRKLGVIDDLKNNKVGPVHLLEELSVTIPKKAWVKSVKETTSPPSNHEVAITGEAISDDVVAEFMSKLEESEYFSNVNLIEARRGGEKDGITYQTFQLTATMKIPDKSDSETAAAMPQN